MPRIGGLLDLQAITDVVQIREGGNKFVRPIYAGNALSVVSTSDKIKLITVRPTSFEKVKSGDKPNNYQVEKAPMVEEVM
jgi:electron transfer flavoprotein alpha subunit